MTIGARRGFILATTMLVMTLLTVMLVAAFILISAEFHTTNGSYSTSRSLNLAQAGLESYFAASHNLSSGSDSTNYGFSGGYARVVARQLRAATTIPKRSALWVVSATGVDSTRSITINGTGTRTVARLAYLNAGALPIHAAVMTANPIYVADGINITGAENCATASASIFGLAANNSDINIGIHTVQLHGTPSGRQLLASRQAAYDSTHIAWDQLSGGTGFTTTAPSPGATYQAYYYTGNLTLAASQTYTGLLVLTGNLSFGDHATWNGVIIAGGWVRSASFYFTVNGAIVTGLNNLTQSGCSTSSTAPCVGPDTINGLGGGGSTNIFWNSCYAASAIATTVSLAPLRNAFMDTWKTY
jgi:hypothetical protein